MLLRSDDINCDNKNLRKFLEITKDVPVLLATEPYWLTKSENESVVELVKQYKNTTIVQHGYDHTNKAKDGEKKSEFPSSRVAEDYIPDIIEGKKILEELFEDQFYPVFIPPWNRFGHNYQILSELGFIGYENSEGFLDMQPKKGFIDEKYFWRKVQTDKELNGLIFHHSWLNDKQFKFIEELIESGVIQWKSIRESS